MMQTLAISIAALAMTSAWAVATEGAPLEHSVLTSINPDGKAPSMFDDILAVAADRKNLHLSPEEATRTLAKFGPFTRNEYSRGSMLLESPKATWGVLGVSFRQDEKDRWQFDDLNFYLPDRATDVPTFGALYEALRSRLGNPRHQKKTKGELWAAAWIFPKKEGVWLVHDDADKMPNENEVQGITTITLGTETEEFED